MQKINSIVHYLINNINKKNIYFDLNNCLKEIIGNFFDKIKINKMKDNILYIFVSDSRILHELNLLSFFILKSLKEKILNLKIIDIKFIFYNFFSKKNYKNLNLKKINNLNLKKNYISNKEESYLFKIKNENLKNLLKLIFQKFVI